mmetsp:Transcript_20518/g.20471  ORF Transcript_20518/g.20471 Transcript_20518/m.20471 type:complete len:115 (+) Transcript_20518:1284-1628(+)|eukprot:CAMPEP_0202951286 /NCGR_PEP_ID=MMETSP1395-20130829/30018_1 /ASSEMBLY_ACC=CAM_ASM_000871 /TAXON_ID=5961 /ORGANISM="Blepharisma japonicum, Strain Stock R1072" /LENGTH=114 /DNA_ID=CAMNT_0049658119 /DNA_START=952 /DNA_END=1296 /DNA_ORIENTATION=+
MSQILMVPASHVLKFLKTVNIVVVFDARFVMITITEITTETNVDHAHLAANGVMTQILVQSVKIEYNHIKMELVNFLALQVLIEMPLQILENCVLTDAEIVTVLLAAVSVGLQI